MDKRPKKNKTPADHMSPSLESIKAGAISGQALGNKTTKKPPKKITENYLTNSGLYYLERYSASTTHFRSVMRRKITRSCRHHPDQDQQACLAMLDSVIDRFQTLGYLNDESYTRMKVSSFSGRGLSRRMILMKLKNAGIAESDIADALNSYAAENNISTEETEMAAALKFARKKHVGPYAGDKPYDKNKVIAAFARAGFSFDVIQKVLNTQIDDIL